MSKEPTARERIIEQIGEIDRDIELLDMQRTSLRSRRWDLVMSLSPDNDPTDQLEALVSVAQQPAWARLGAEVGPPTTGEVPIVQEPLRAVRPSEGYVPVRMSVHALDEYCRPIARVHEINASLDEEPQVHLVRNSPSEHPRLTDDVVAYCGAHVSGEYGWWPARPDNADEITVCLDCVTLTRSDR